MTHFQTKFNDILLISSETDHFYGKCQFQLENKANFTKKTSFKKKLKTISMLNFTQTCCSCQHSSRLDVNC